MGSKSAMNIAKCVKQMARHATEGGFFRGDMSPELTIPSESNDLKVVLEGKRLSP